MYTILILGIIGFILGFFWERVTQKQKVLEDQFTSGIMWLLAGATIGIVLAFLLPELLNINIENFTFPINNIH